MSLLVILMTAVALGVEHTIRTSALLVLAVVIMVPALFVDILVFTGKAKRETGDSLTEYHEDARIGPEPSASDGKRDGTRT